MKLDWIIIILIIVLMSGLLVTGCTFTGNHSINTSHPMVIPSTPILQKTDETAFFLYSPVAEQAENTPIVPSYSLPLSTRDITNFDVISKQLSLNQSAINKLNQNGFVVIPNPLNLKSDDVVGTYTTLGVNKIPVFVTSDSVLHLYHVQFDDTLREIEEREFYRSLWNISTVLLEDSTNTYKISTGTEKEAARRNVAFFSVGVSLLDPEKAKDLVPAYVQDDVTLEMKYITDHQGLAVSPIFRYYEDYSQYVPRGHYTRSENLKKYFLAMMWYGRMSFLLSGDGSCAIVSPYDARIQTLGAFQITSGLDNNPDIKKQYDRIATVTAFYVGTADDLSITEYEMALKSVTGTAINNEPVSNEDYEKIKKMLMAYSAPWIYGGTGKVNSSTPLEMDRCLESTKGFRLMGQKYIPDSFIFSQLVNPYTGQYVGSGKPFTLVMSDVGPVRGFPRGLDAMAILGSDRAKEIMDIANDTNYERYPEQYKELKNEFGSLSTAEWNRNLYWSWLYSLKSLFKEYSSGYPTFMQTDAWKDKDLNTALSSWSELRHDTILYSKQSYTGYTSATEPLKVTGYVEPVPELYHRLGALSKMSSNGLDDMGVLDNTSRARLKHLEKTLDYLANISEEELRNEELSDEDYYFIGNFGGELDSMAGDRFGSKSMLTTLVADVHTDQNSQNILEEGTGYVQLMVVAYKVPDGQIMIGVGPVMRYYEFKQPMSNRLSDETWRDLLASDPPKPPEWTASFADN